MKKPPRIAFLHIPKTAGQSLHHQISSLYNENEICPARSNKHLYAMSINDIKKYNFFSGHLDWSIIKLAGPFDFTFTVTRDPIDRIISFYFYIKKEAKRFLEMGSDLPPGMRYCHDNSLKAYFCAKDSNMRTFILNHYDNFYTYYFASGSYSGNQLLSNSLTSSTLLELAFINCKSLSNIYTINEIHNIKTDIDAKLSVSLPQLMQLNENKSTSPNDRLNQLDLLAEGWDWRKEFKTLTELDYQLLHKLEA